MHEDCLRHMLPLSPDPSLAVEELSSLSAPAKLPLQSSAKGSAQGAAPPHAAKAQAAAVGHATLFNGAFRHGARPTSEVLPGRGGLGTYF
eukprot:1161715-Pelagomonas_calceolata.AAC.9